MRTAKTKDCAYSFLFLGNRSPYGRAFKKYRLCRLFQKVGFFESADARKRFVKALLTTNPFPQLCKFCKSHVGKLLKHQLFECQGLKHEHHTLHAKLLLYSKNDRQPIQKDTLNQLLSSIIHDKCLLRYFTHFLQASDF